MSTEDSNVSARPVRVISISNRSDCCFFEREVVEESESHSIRESTICEKSRDTEFDQPAALELRHSYMLVTHYRNCQSSDLGE